MLAPVYAGTCAIEQNRVAAKGAGDVDVFALVAHVGDFRGRTAEGVRETSECGDGGFAAADVARGEQRVEGVADPGGLQVFEHKLAGHAVGHVGEGADFQAARPERGEGGLRVGKATKPLAEHAKESARGWQFVDGGFGAETRGELGGDAGERYFLEPGVQPGIVTAQHRGGAFDLGGVTRGVEVSGERLQRGGIERLPVQRHAFIFDERVADIEGDGFEVNHGGSQQGRGTRRLRQGSPS